MVDTIEDSSHLNWLAIVLALACPFACAPEQKAPRSPELVTEKVEQPSCPEEISPADVLTQHDNCRRTGANLSETLLTPGTVQSGHFGRLFDWQVDGQIYAQPLYVSQFQLNGKSANLVIVATMENNVYAFKAPTVDSDVKPPNSLLWKISSDRLGPPLPKDYMYMDFGFITGYNIEPWIGITSTPVVDRKRGLVFFTVKSGKCDPRCRQISYTLFAVDIASGAIKDHIEITGRYTSPDGFQSPFLPQHQLQRAALLEANDSIYIAFGSHQDQPPYEGWLFGYNAGNLHEPPRVYCSACGVPHDHECKQSRCDGGIWQAGAGPAIDNDGNVYLATGNGAYDSAVGDLGSSFIKFDKDLNVLGSWTPANFVCLNRTDSDLGSAGPLVLSQPSVLISGGKEGLLYAIDAAALRGTKTGAGKQPGTMKPCTDVKDYTPDATGPGYLSVQAAPHWESDFPIDIIGYFAPGILSMGFHHIHGAPAFWKVLGKNGYHSLIYLSAERDVLRAFEYPKDFVRPPSPMHEPQDSLQSDCQNSPKGMPGGFLTISANGSDSDSGIVWASMPRPRKNALVDIVPGILRAYKAYQESDTGAPGTLTELWNSDDGTNIPKKCRDVTPVEKDQVGNFAKFAPPTVADGKVYLATFSNSLVVYGLKKSEPTLEDQYFAARLAFVGALPDTAQPNKPIKVTIAATNIGTVPWSKDAGVHLTPWLSPASSRQGMSALILQNVEPQKPYQFSFTIIAPVEEGEYYYSWGLTDPSGNRFGTSTPEWHLSVVRPRCELVRQKATQLVAELLGRGINPGEAPQAARLSPTKMARVRRAEELITSIKHDATKFGCRLPPIEP